MALESITPTLKPLMEMKINLHTPFQNISATRLIADSAGGTFSGDRLKGTILQGGDWLTMTNGWGMIDVRLTLQTADEKPALIYCSYTGKFDLSILAVDPATVVPFGQFQFITHGQLETGDERYSWLNNVVFVATGRILGGNQVQYQVFEVDGLKPAH